MSRVTQLKCSQLNTYIPLVTTKLKVTYANSNLNVFLIRKKRSKVLICDIKIPPSSSAFIKKRLDVVLFSENYPLLIDEIKEAGISVEGFKVEYLVVDGDTTQYPERLERLRDVGYVIEGNPEYYSPTITYAICFYQSIWYFGILSKDDYTWYKHKQKPRSNSNSIKVNIAKALINIAAKGNLENKLIDTCCGVGTVMLEACFAGYIIEGCDINWKQTRDTRINIAHFKYEAKVYRCDIKYMIQKYDAGIVDLPYNLLSRATDSDILHIIKSAGEIANRLVVVSTSDITDFIQKTGFRILDYCSVRKL